MRRWKFFLHKPVPNVSKLYTLLKKMVAKTQTNQMKTHIYMKMGSVVTDTIFEAHFVFMHEANLYVVPLSKVHYFRRLIYNLIIAMTTC